MANRFFNQFQWSLEKNPVAIYAHVAFGDTSVVTTTADTAGNKAGTFFRVKGFVTGRQYYFWFKVSGSGTDPANVGETGIEVDITTGDSANTIATAIYTAAIANPYILQDFTMTHGTGTVTFTALAGGCLNAHDGLSMYSTGFTFSNTSLPVLDQTNSKGIKSFTKSGVGIFVVTFGTASPTSTTDIYNRIFEASHVFVSTAAAPAAPLMYVSSNAVATTGQLTLKFLAADGTTATDPACGEDLYLCFDLKNTTAP